MCPDSAITSFSNSPVNSGSSPQGGDSQFAEEQVSIEGIQRVVAAHYRVTVADIRGLKRHRAISMPRHIAMYLARKLTGASYPKIGSRFGGRNHATIINAFRKIRRLSQDPRHPAGGILQQLERQIAG